MQSVVARCYRVRRESVLDQVKQRTKGESGISVSHFWGRMIKIPGKEALSSLVPYFFLFPTGLPDMGAVVAVFNLLM
jgi:hypothetical protein